jgi:hypothetical protein
MYSILPFGKLCGKYSDIVLLQLELKFASSSSRNLFNRLLNNIWSSIHIHAITTRGIQHGQCTVGACGYSFEFDGERNRLGGVVDRGLEGVVAGRGDTNNVVSGTERRRRIG